MAVTLLMLAFGACGETGGGSLDGAVRDGLDGGGAADAPTSEGGCNAVEQVVQELPGERCIYTIPEPPDARYQRHSIRVLVDHVYQLPRDPSRTDGWDYVDPADTKLQIFGPACDEIVAGTYETVHIVYFCSLI